MGDLYLNIVESKNREIGGFDRQSVILFADDLQEFLKGFDESLRVLEKAVREKRHSGPGEQKRSSGEKFGRGEKPTGRERTPQRGERPGRDDKKPQRGERPRRDGKKPQRGGPAGGSSRPYRAKTADTNERPKKNYRQQEGNRRVVIKKRER